MIIKMDILLLGVQLKLIEFKKYMEDIINHQNHAKILVVFAAASANSRFDLPIFVDFRVTVVVKIKETGV